jgi:predicted lipoprotein with Yx(FWY)xxD motif
MARSSDVQRMSLALVMLVAVGCSKKDKTADSAAAVVVAPPGGPPVAVAVPADAPVALQVAAPPGTGVILTDANGRAVYVLDAACTGDCLTQFTPVSGTATVKAGDTAVKSSMAGSTTGASGSAQATYNGSPLYYYNGDQAPGDMKGAGVKAGGATAHLVGPNGKKVGK